MLDDPRSDQLVVNFAGQWLNLRALQSWAPTAALYPDFDDNLRLAMRLEVTMQDPKALAKPWTGTLYYELRNDWDLGEISCSGDYLDFNTFESFSFKKAGRD